MSELPSEPKADEIVVPEGIRRARAAFLRDFAALMADRKTRGKYVLYHNDTLVAVAKKYITLVHEEIARNLPEDAAIIFKVAPGEDAFHKAVAEEGELP